MRTNCGPRTVGGKNNRLRAGLVASAAGLAVCVGAAHAIDINWNSGSGNWSDPLLWSPNNVPDNGGENALIGIAGSYTVAVNGNYSIGSLSLTNPTGLLAFASGNSLALGGSLVNNSTITINATGGGGDTHLQALISMGWSGTGSVVLNANAGGNLNTAYLIYNGGGEVVTQAAGHTLRGTGRVYVGFTNNGTINADRNGLVLLLSNTGKTNNALATATNGGLLDISTTVTQGAGGSIVADGGTVRFTGATINGGVLSQMNAGVLSVTGNSRWDNVTIAGGARVESGINLQAANSLTNNGALTVNQAGGGGGTNIQFLTSAALNGTGTILLNANAGGNLDTATLLYNGGGEVLTQAATHTIRGSGRIYVGLNNLGVVNADVNGRVLLLSNTGKTNQNLLTATNGGLLDISTTITQTGLGRIVAANGTVRMTSATIDQGQVTTTGTGITQVTGGSRFNSVTNSGDLRVVSGIGLQCADALVNNGVITINETAGGGGTYLQFLNTQALSGNGTIVLNANAGGNLETSILTYNGGGEVLTHAATHTIRGTGRIYVGTTNNGTISADVSGKVLNLLGTAKTNNNLMRSMNGGSLDITNTTITQGGSGVLRAENASSVRFSGATINGGLITTTGSGIAQVTGGSRFNSVTNSGDLRVVSGIGLQCADALANNGVITINESAGGAGTYLQFLNSQALSGNGTIVLNANAGGNLETSILTYSGGGEVLTHAATHTIRGTGRIYVNTTNNGTISADVPGKVLNLLGPGKTNNNLIRSINGGSLDITNTTITQGGSGVLRAENASSLRFSGATINGGLITTTGSGIAQVTGSGRFNSVTNSGDLRVVVSIGLQCADALVNNGVITINESAGGAGTYLQFLNSQTVNGTGEIRLNANAGGNLDTAFLTYSGGGEVLTNGTNHSITGYGRIYVRLLNNGKIAPGRPGAPIGQIDLRGSANLTMGPTSDFICQIRDAGAANVDRITGDRAIALDGALHVSTIAPYSGNRGDRWTIVSGSSVTGSFSDVTTPPTINGVGYRVEYFSNHVDLVAVCYADVNEDGGIDGSDVSAFFDLWEAGNPIADLNNDGGVDGSDIEVFFAYWENGGC